MRWVWEDDNKNNKENREKYGNRRESTGRTKETR